MAEELLKLNSEGSPQKQTVPAASFCRSIVRWFDFYFSNLTACIQPFSFFFFGHLYMSKKICSPVHVIDLFVTSVFPEGLQGYLSRETATFKVDSFRIMHCVCSALQILAGI